MSPSFKFRENICKLQKTLESYTRAVQSILVYCVAEQDRSSSLSCQDSTGPPSCINGPAAF